jgi:YggT family protein
MAAIVLMLILQTISLTLTLLIQSQFVTPIAVIMLSIANLLSLGINVFLFSIIIQAVLSWINPMAGHNPALTILYMLNEPLLRPARKLLPPFSGLDLSPLIVILGLQVLKMLLIPPLQHLALW